MTGVLNVWLNSAGWARDPRNWEKSGDIAEVGAVHQCLCAHC